MVWLCCNWLLAIFNWIWQETLLYAMPAAVERTIERIIVDGRTTCAHRSITCNRIIDTFGAPPFNQMLSSLEPSSFSISQKSSNDCCYCKILTLFRFDAVGMVVVVLLSKQSTSVSFLVEEFIYGRRCLGFGSGVFFMVLLFFIRGLDLQF